MTDILIRLYRPEGYEDVHPEIILDDLNINPAFRPELVAAAGERVDAPAEPTSLPRHKFWGAGEPDCPADLKAPNGELHTMRCKVCGDGWRKSANVCFAALGPADPVRAALEKLLRAEEKYVRDTGRPQPDDLIQDAVNEARALLGWPTIGVSVPDNKTFAASPADAPQPAKAAEPDTRKPWEKTSWTCARAAVTVEGVRCPETGRCRDCIASPAKAACPAPVEPSLLTAVEEALASLDAGMVQGAADTLREALADSAASASPATQPMCDEDGVAAVPAPQPLHDSVWKHSCPKLGYEVLLPVWGTCKACGTVAPGAVGINGLTEAETSATASVMGIVGVQEVGRAQK